MFPRQLIATASLRFLPEWITQETKFQGWLRRLKLSQALSSTYQKFSQRHPRWVASLFDEYFLRGQAAPLLARYAQSVEELPTATELANAWFDQLGLLMSSPSQERRTEVIAVAGDFLGVLDAEWRRLEGCSQE
ncbi:MAG: hypothetical protein U0401_34030 [Anaerolineae bacterium]